METMKSITESISFYKEELNRAENALYRASFLNKIKELECAKMILIKHHII